MDENGVDFMGNNFNPDPMAKLKMPACDPQWAIEPGQRPASFPVAP
jgi:hypothetical protein